jgi:predicted nucleic acid-binding protein
VKGIADTGFVVAFLSNDDLHHRWAAELANQLTEPLLTCEAVIAEAAFHMRDARMILALLHERFISLSFDADQHLLQLQALAERYADRRPDFADLCLIRMSELYPRHSVVTTDRRDFGVYRRNKRDVIPLICPRN